MTAMRILCAVVVALGIVGELRADDGATARHLLLGVHAFKAEHYDEALVELRLVARAPDAPADLAFYLGPTLYKLARYPEALAVFLDSHAAPDALTDFYRGQTYYQLRLFRKARAVFAELRARGLGPALRDAADRYVAAVDAAYRTPPAAGAIDYYLAEGTERAVRDPAVGAEYLGEAAARGHRPAARRAQRRRQGAARAARALTAGRAISRRRDPARPGCRAASTAGGG